MTRTPPHVQVLGYAPEEAPCRLFNISLVCLFPLELDFPRTTLGRPLDGAIGSKKRHAFGFGVIRCYSKKIRDERGSQLFRLHKQGYAQPTNGAAEPLCPWRCPSWWLWQWVLQLLLRWRRRFRSTFVGYAVWISPSWSNIQTDQYDPDVTAMQSRWSTQRRRRRVLRLMRFNR